MKIRMKKYAAILLAILMMTQVLPALAGNQAQYTFLSETVEGSDEGFRPALTISGQKDGTYLLTGQSFSLTLPDEYTDVTWKSSDDTVATVTEKGIVEAKGQGTVTITVTDNLDPSISASITLDVINPDVSYIVTYEVKYPSDATAVIVSATEKKQPRDTTFTEKTTPVVGSKAVRHVLWTGDYDVENYTMTGWKNTSTGEVFAQGQKVKLSGDTTYTAVFEKKQATRKQQGLKVNYYNKKEDGTEYYIGKGEWAGRSTTAWLETVDGTVYATFPLTDSKDGSTMRTEVSGSGVNYSVNPWYFAKTILGLGNVTELTDEILAQYKESYKSTIGFRLKEVKGVSADDLTAYVKANYDSSIDSYSDYVFELGEVITLPYGNKSNGYYFEPVQAGGKTADAEVRVLVDNKVYYICQGELTEQGMDTVLKSPWPAKDNGPYGGKNPDEQNVFGEKVNGKYVFTSPVDPDGVYIKKAASVRKVLDKVGMTGENEENWDVVWFKIGQTRRGFLIEGFLVQKEAAKKQIIIVANGDKQKLTYDGGEHKITYTFESEDKAFKASKVKLVGEEPTRVDCGITLGSMTSSDFKYEDADYEPLFIVNNGSVWIMPAALTVTADDKTKDSAENDPVFTASFNGLKGEDTGDDISVKFVREEEDSDMPGEYEIMPVGEKTQGNYKITFKPGTLTITGEAPVYSVKIKSTLDGVTEFTMNTQVTLTAVVQGFDEEYTLQWWVSTDGTEESMQEIPGATGKTYTYQLNEQTITWKWRVVVSQK